MYSGTLTEDSISISRRVMDKYYGRCINEIPTNSTGTDVVICGRPVAVSGDQICPRCAKLGAENV